MQWKGANRLYSRQSLRNWSGLIDFSWEERFSSEALHKGRSLYRRGGIREVSLGDEDAIMTCKIGKTESYSVVEWENGRFRIRSSSGDMLLANAIAVAGFLEIEELLADEDLSLLPSEGLESAADNEDVVGNPARPDLPPLQRELHLVLDTHYEGLICEAYWVAEDGSRSPALSGAAGTPNARDASERERLITLAARARKSHFSYSRDFNGYLLENIGEISFFVSKVWPTWRETFSTEERENLAHIREAMQEADLKAVASESESGKLDIRWTLEVGQKSVSLSDTERLVGRADSTTLIPNLGIVKLSGESRSLLKRWEQARDESSEGLSKYQLFTLFPDGESRLELDDQLRRWRDSLRLPSDRQLELLDGLRPYQQVGVRWMVSLLEHDCHCLLADEMGLGKTVQVIALLKATMDKPNRVLIVCPASVVPVWIAEFAKFAPEFRVSRYNGQSLESPAEALEVLVTSFALLRRRIELLSRHTFEFAVIDEAQFIKNPDAKVTRTCFEIKDRKRVALTGTPIENKPLDLWPAFRFLMPGLLGSRASFERRLTDNPTAFRVQLKLQVAPFMLRRTKQEVASDLPEKIVIDQLCSITRRQAAAYAQLCQGGVERLGNDLDAAFDSHRFSVLSLLTRLRQVCCDPALLPWEHEAAVEDSGKLMVLLERLIEILGTGHKVVIFSQFTRFIARVRAMIEAAFPELPIYELTGSTLDRETPVRTFQESSDTAVMLVSLRAAGTGITLHSADYVFMMDPWWNPAVEKQAIDRVHRIGQTKTVMVYRLIAEGTIEERIQVLQRSKEALFESLIQRSGGASDALSQQFKSLEALLALSSEARASIA